MLPYVEHWTTSREEFFEFSLVEMNDQVFEGGRLKILTLLVAPEDRIGLRSALSVSSETCFEELVRGVPATLTS